MLQIFLFYYNFGKKIMQKSSISTYFRGISDPDPGVRTKTGSGSDQNNRIRIRMNTLVATMMIPLAVMVIRDRVSMRHMNHL